LQPLHRIRIDYAMDVRSTAMENPRSAQHRAAASQETLP
jgi:hypothetical protein